MSKPPEILPGRDAQRVGDSHSSDAQLAFENILQGFYRQFHEQKGLGNEVVAAAERGAGAALEVGQAGDEDNRSSGVSGEGAQFLAQFKTVHPGHIDVEKDEVELVFGKHV